jgi:hypothetical protein
MNPRANTWGNWREAVTVVRAPRNVRRTLCIALTVGSVFFAMNQLGAILAGTAGAIVWLKAAMTYLTPLIVSNVGVLSATRRLGGPAADAVQQAH